MSWLESLPEVLRDAPFLAKAETPEAALEQIKNASAYMGNSIRIPGEDAGDEDRKAFYTKVMEKAPNLMLKPSDDNIDEVLRMLGKPDAPDKYQAKLPEGAELPPDFENFSKIAHEAGLTQKQFEAVVAKVVASQTEAQTVAAAELQEEMAALNKEWGQAFEDRMTAVKNFLKLSDAPEGLVDLFTEKAMSPAEIKWLFNVAASTKSAVELATTKDEGKGALTPDEARNQIQEMLNNAAHPYWIASDPRHKAAINRMVELQRAAGPAR